MLTVLRAPDPRLRVKTKPLKKFTPELIKLAREMIKLAQGYTDPEGVGLSTTQIGRDERFCVAKLYGKKFAVFINPQITYSSKKTKIFFEGCLSIPDYYGEVTRPFSVTVRYQDEDGQFYTKKLRGVAAWILQHEIDHLNGKLFMDRVLEQKGRVFKIIGKDKVGSDIFEEVKLI